MEGGIHNSRCAVHVSSYSARSDVVFLSLPRYLQEGTGTGHIDNVSSKTNYVVCILIINGICKGVIFIVFVLYLISTIIS